MSCDGLPHTTILRVEDSARGAGTRKKAAVSRNETAHLKVVSPSSRRFASGAKARALVVLGGTAEAVPFPVQLRRGFLGRSLLEGLDRGGLILFDVEDGVEDRKSTRLNSSHLGISY